MAVANHRAQVQALRNLYRPPDPGKEETPPVARQGFRGQTIGRGLQPDSTTKYHVTTASAEPILSRLEGVQKTGSGWRARCPACEGRSRKLSITESDGRVLIHCFAGCAAADVLAAVGLRWADIMPPRSWPPSRDEQRRASRAIREAGWAAAVAVLSLESKIVALAANDIHRLGGLQSSRDLDRLNLAVERIGAASATLIDAVREVH